MRLIRSCEAALNFSLACTLALSFFFYYITNINIHNTRLLKKSLKSRKVENIHKTVLVL